MKADGNKSLHICCLNANDFQVFMIRIDTQVVASLVRMVIEKGDQL